jgi:hypothetical protein
MSVSVIDAPMAKRMETPMKKKLSKKLLDLISEAQAKHPKWSKIDKFIYVVNKNGGINSREIGAIREKLGYKI